MTETITPVALGGRDQDFLAPAPACAGPESVDSRS